MNILGSASSDWASKQRAARVTGEQDALGQRRRREQVDGGHGRAAYGRRDGGGGRVIDSAAVAEFSSSKEFRDVMDRTFALMSDDPDMGPKLRDADTPQRFEFTDLDLVVNIRAGGADEPNLAWEWSDEINWEPKVRMAMSSETANRYFQGKENVAVAIARRRIKAGGDVKAALALIPITKPLYERYREMVAADYPHLKL